jgi:hypothetical protein
MAIDPAASAATARYARGPLLGAIVVAGFWHVTNDLAGVAFGWSDYSSPPLVAAVWLVLTIVGVLAAVDLLQGRRRSAVWAFAGIAVLLAAVAAQVATCPGDLTFSMANWAWANFPWFAMLLLWRWPLGWLFAAMGANVLTTLVAMGLTRDLDRVTLARYATVVLGAGAIQLGVAWGGRVLESRARQATREASERAKILTAQAAGETVHHDRQRRYRETGQVAQHLLAGLASGRLDPTDPTTQRQCAVGASRLRRLIVEHDDVPSRLVHELRACADVAERRGVAVSLETVGNLPPLPVEVRRAMTEAPMHVLAAARSQARITVVWSGDDREAEVSVVADADVEPAPSPPTEGVETLTAREGDTLWLRTRWRGQ